MWFESDTLAGQQERSILSRVDITSNYSVSVLAFLMAKKINPDSRVNLRKSPLQRRSAETVDVIVEASARILETKGFEAFNTNAIAEMAGVSIGSLYQYFPGKYALLSALIERQMKPFLDMRTALASKPDFRSALRFYIEVAVNNQIRRPELARLIDLAERQEMFNDLVSSASSFVLPQLERMLKLPGAPLVRKRSLAAADILAIVKALTDVAGERRETESAELLERIERAILGYLG